MKKIIMSIFALAFLFVGTSAFAYVSWNTNADDCPGSNIGNYSTGAGIPAPGSNDCWSLTSVSATGGQTINVEQYYHNTGNQPATNAKVYISVSPSIGTASTIHTFTSSLSASPSGTSLGTTTLTLSTPQALSFGSTYWYPNQTSNPTIINSPQIISASGLSIGTVNQGWAGQGSVVTSFVVGNTQLPACNINTFTANPSTILLGGSSTLSWSTSNCNSATITSSNGSFNYNVPSSNVSNGSTSVSPTGNTTYTITGYGANSSTHTKTVTVLVNAPIYNCVITNFSANPTQINSGGSSVLSWNTSDCTSVSITPNIGNVGTSGSRIVYPNISTTYTITGYGGSGTSDTKTVTVTVNIPVPNCVINSFLANPTQIFSGGSSTLSWSTTNCTNVTISNLGYNVPTNGTQVVYPTQTTTYVLTAYGQNGGQQTRTQTVTVNNLTPNCSISSFLANPTQIFSGNSSTLSWNTSNCTSVSISPNVGSVNNSGTSMVYPTQTTTYILTAYGQNGGQQTQSQTVVVNSPTPSCSISHFSASPTQINTGGTSTLNWGTSNCNNVTISNLGYNVPTSGTQVVYPTQTTTYVLTAYGTSGTQQTQSVTVSVNTFQNNCSINSFYANPNSINTNGSSTLIWNTSNCTSVNIFPNIFNTNVSGSQIVYPTQTTTYTLTAYGANGTQQTRYETITVQQAQACMITNFSANPNSINTNGSSTLTWNTNNCTSVSISSLNYNVPVSGSQVVYPTQTTTYILTAYGTSGIQQTQPVTVSVNTYIPPVIASCAVSTISTNITQNSATLNGMLTGGGSYNTYFEYGRTVNLGLQTPSRSSNGITVFSDTIGNLSSGTVYYFRLVSNCSNGNIARGDMKVFQTLSPNVRPIVIQGNTVIGTSSPIMLKIENRFSSIRIDDIVSYVVTYKNIGTKKLTRPMVQVVIPDGLNFLNASRGTYAENTRTLSVPIEDLNAGDEGTIYLEARVDPLILSNREVVTTALLIYTNDKGAQENAIAYVLNNSIGNYNNTNNNSLGALSFFSGFWGIGLIGWLLIIIIILLIILIYRRYFYQKHFTNIESTTHTETDTRKIH